MFPTKDDIKRLEDKLDKIQETINKLHTRIDGFEETLTGEVSDVKVKCEKMESHIDFIERVYTNVKSPMGYLVDKVNYMFGRSSSNLPEIENVASSQQQNLQSQQVLQDISSEANDRV